MTSISEAFCYWPNGTIAQNTTSGEYALPCDTGAAVSSCCLPGQQCNTQFRCQDVFGNFTQASCTQKDFDSYYCPCPHQIVGLDATTGCNDGTVCCGVNNESCCDKGLGRLSVIYNFEDYLPTATASIEVYISGYTPSTTATNTASQSSTGNGTSSAAVMSQTSSITGSNVASTSTITASSSDSSSGLSSGAKTGIGIGIACVVLAIAGLLGWFILRKRRQAKVKGKVKGPGTQAERLEGDDFDGDTWFRKEVEGDTHHASGKAIEMQQRNENHTAAVPSPTNSGSPNALKQTELDASSPYRETPRGNEIESSHRLVNEMEQPSARPNELESPSQAGRDQTRQQVNELESPQQRHELE